MIQSQLELRPARKSDRTAIANLMYFETHVHRHLDWRGPLDWLGYKEYWVLEQANVVCAALACPPDPEGVSWLRLFAHSSEIPGTVAWETLWEYSRNNLEGSDIIVASISTADWFCDLLLKSGFVIKQKIVVLEQDTRAFAQRPIPEGIELRLMTEEDIPAVFLVDKSGFSVLWRNSEEALFSGLNQAGYATIALLKGEIVGYQISTRNSFGAHLARLAVIPSLQGHGIGYCLVQDLIQATRKVGLLRLTVNTQNDNQASLALYNKIGFKLTGEQYKVFSYQL